jgi:glycosyltransferase involved in cell wall biosynthesis
MLVVTDTSRGGTPTRFATLARAMRDRNWDCALVSVMKEGAVLRDLADQGFETFSLGVGSAPSGGSAVVRLRRLIRVWKPDVLQTALWHANVLGRIAAINTGVPVVSGYQSVDDDKPANRVLLDRFTRRLAMAHVCASRAVAERAIERERLLASSVHVAASGKDVERWRPKGRRDDVRASLGIPDGTPVAGWAGRIHPTKDLGVLIRAVASLADWRLLVVGDGPQSPLLSRWAQESGLGSRLIHVPETSEVGPFLEAMDVYCLVSRWEGSPGGLIEAMASGLPVVATSVGGVTEIVTPGVDGLLVPPNDPDSVATAIEEALQRPDLGARARQTVEERFTEEAMVDVYERVWRAVTS